MENSIIKEVIKEMCTRVKGFENLSRVRQVEVIFQALTSNIILEDLAEQLKYIINK